MELQWKYKEIPNESIVNALAKEINIDPWLACLLVQRGIHTFEEAKAFFRPNIDHLHDPYLMKDMDRAVERLVQAISLNEKILVFGDYDVDGTCSVSLFYGFLKNHYSNLEYYIPDRYKEGYGISFQGIEYAHKNGFSLIISIDCGIRSIDKIAKANEFGIDFIICDHHLPGDELPNAIAILDPKRHDCPYPFKELCGCGVAFKFLHAFCTHNAWPLESLFEQLDLVAIATAADIVPIVGENRILSHFGLEALNKTNKIGIKALIKSAGLTPPLQISQVVFGLAPRINAAGRIDHAYGAVELLLSDDEQHSTDQAFSVNENNSTRREFDKQITEEAIDMLRNDEWLQNAYSTVLFKKDWHKGVIGIVASRCIEQYYRPTIILTESNGKATGSARSVHDFDVHHAIEQCSDLLDQFGGHKFAAGLTMPIEHVDAFRLRFEEVVRASITDDMRIPQQSIDLEIPLSSISMKALQIIKQMGPFGPGNMQPVFASTKVRDTGKSRLLKDAHIQFNITQADGTEIKGIGFGMADKWSLVQSGKPFDICYTVEENTFRDVTTVQIMVKDVRESVI